MKIKNITSTAMLLALLISGQAVFKMIPMPAGQYVVGTWVNLCLALSVLIVGLYPGLILASISPWVAFILQIAPTPIIVIPLLIGIGNILFVVLIHIGKKGNYRQINNWVGMLTGALIKFLFLSMSISYLVLPLVSLPEAFVTALLFSFGVIQFITATMGGTLALIVFQKQRIFRFIKRSE